ncbi:YigZ family protein [Vagococcus coleopterorum]|uniref:YigZ family protein n=1 Tax=Vagococcus coleopterorum TaxID=2714946 RepID=A0A6G8AN90_9ENTE|nr:YigZ family protein [Vagococcus coleopterorum]QIL46538.1 YigZ family protein [Vagococcus coleopterorum]
MITDYLTLKENGQHEIEIKKSRFICHLFRIDSDEQAKELIQKIKKEHWKATHNCHAYLVGDNNDIQRSSDDGEPSGTAGLPMLEVLKKRELINTLAVVTRYFGGTELGKGGLIRAYGGSVSEALDEIGIVQGTLQQEMQVTVDYPNHPKLENFLENSVYNLKETIYTDKVQLLIMVDEQTTDTFEQELIELLSGQVTITAGKTSYFEKEI